MQAKINADDYVFSFSKNYRSAYFYKAKARNLENGKMYAVRFQGKKRFAFFVYENFIWNIYLVNSCNGYNFNYFSNTAAFLRFENDLAQKIVLPYMKIKTSKTPGTYFNRINGYLPTLPFYFQKELKYLSPEEEKIRYKYKKAPKYLIIASFDKFVKENSSRSYFVFGCNNESLYKQISQGRGIVVTNTHENIKAVALFKFENKYGIVPKQHCLKVVLKSKAG